jgi:hypothetical protein
MIMKPTCRLAVLSSDRDVAIDMGSQLGDVMRMTVFGSLLATDIVRNGGFLLRVQLYKSFCEGVRYSILQVSFARFSTLLH